MEYKVRCQGQKEKKLPLSKKIADATAPENTDKDQRHESETLCH